MARAIPLNELNPDTRAKLKLGNITVQPKLVALGRILLNIEGLTNREALWALRTAINHIKGFHKKGVRA